MVGNAEILTDKDEHELKEFKTTMESWKQNNKSLRVFVLTNEMTSLSSSKNIQNLLHTLAEKLLKKCLLTIN